MVTLRQGSWTAATLLVTIGLLGSCGSAPDVPLGPDGKPDEVLLLGRDIFGQRCASCHGSDGAGGRGPKLSDGAVAEEYPEIADQIDILINGKGDGMPAFSDKLSADEIEAVARYTREVL